MESITPQVAASFKQEQRHPHPAFESLQRIGRSQISILSALFWHTGPDWDMGHRRSADDFIFIPVTGSLHISSAQREDDIHPGHCLCLPEGRSCTVRYADGHLEAGIFALHARISDAAGLPLLQHLHEQVLPFDLQLVDSLHSLVSIFNQDNSSGQEFGKSIYRLLLSQWVLQGISIGTGQDMDPRISKAAAIIHQHSCSELQVAELAREVGLGVVQFRKLFKQCMQQTPKLYIAHLRLRQAATALLESNDSIKTIALACGFQDEHYFHNSFKRFFQCTPMQYRERGFAET